MPGKPGSGGVPPKRTEERRRRNNEAGQMNTTRAPGARHVEVPAASPDWHTVARDWYESLAASGQSRFYEPSDWMVAYYVAEAMTRNLKQNTKFSAVLFSSVMSAMTELMVTEGARRRLRLELERNPVTDEDEDASVTALAQYRSRLGG